MLLDIENTALCAQEKKRQEAAAKKAEAKKLAEEEEAQLATSAKKTPSKQTGSKVHPYTSLQCKHLALCCLAADLLLSGVPYLKPIVWM